MYTRVRIDVLTRYTNFYVDKIFYYYQFGAEN
jgi:hypothetical protein